MGAKTSGFNEEQDIYLVSKCLPSSYLLITWENFNLTIEKSALHHFTHLIEFNITGLGTDQHHVPPEKMNHEGTVSFL